MKEDDRNWFRDHLGAAEQILSALLALDRWEGSDRANLGSAAAHLDQALYDIIASLKTMEPEGEDKEAFEVLVRRQEDHDAASGERYDEWADDDDQRTLASIGLGPMEAFFEQADRWKPVLDEAAVRRTAINIEMLLKMYLLDRGYRDDWLLAHVGNDIEKALDCALRTGLAEQPAEITTLIARLNRHQRDQTFGAMVRDSQGASVFDTMRLTKALLISVQKALGTDLPRLQ